MRKWLERRRANRERQQLQQQYERLLEEARDLQRGGDIKAFASKTAAAEEVGARLDGLRQHDKGE